MVGRTEWRVDSIPSRGTHMQAHEGNVVRAARGPKLWLLHSAWARLLSFPGPMLMELKEVSVCHGWSLNGRAMLLERPQRPTVQSVLRACGGVLSCVEHQGAKRRARRRCARSGIVVGRTEWRVDSIPSRGTHMQSHEGNVVRAARGPKLWLLHSACARLLSFPGPMLMEIEEVSVCHGWSLNGRTMLLERPQRPTVRSVLRACGGGAVVRRTAGSEEACSSLLRTVWNCGCSNRVESRFNSIPWHTHAVARRERRPRCTRSEIVVNPFGSCALFELSRTEAGGDGRGIRVPRLVVERTDHAPRASTTTNRAKRPESVRRGCCRASNSRERRGMLVSAAHGLELWLVEPGGEAVQFHPLAHTCRPTKG